jgi:hypothetical protein
MRTTRLEPDAVPLMRTTRLEPDALAYVSSRRKSLRVREQLGELVQQA